MENGSNGTNVEESSAKRHRATAKDMEKRKQKAIEVVENSSSPVTLEQIRSALSINQPSVVSLTRSLIDDGKLTVAGRNGRRILLRLTNKSDVAKAPKATTPKTTTKPTTETASISINALLDRIHLGDDLEVVGYAVTKTDGIKLDLLNKSVPGAKVLTVAIPAM